jgi:tetratricopeptide (TPR) repeat protein
MRARQSVNDTIAWLRAADDPNAIAGAAFLVSPHLALTCAHVVRDHLGLGKPTPRQLPTGTICLTFQGLRVEAEARVVPSGWWPGGDDDDVEDVAVLELATPLADIKLPALAVFPASAALECEIYGTTGGYETIGQTVYAQLAAKPSWRGWHQIDARAGRESSYFVRPGFSGAPVLDALGNTIWGMVAIVETAPEKLVAYAIAPAHLRIATDAVLEAARARQDRVEPPKKPGPLDQLAREALAALLGENVGSDAPSPERIEELRSALRDLAERGRKPADAGSIAEALELLKGGESSDAEAVFAGIIKQKRGEGRAAYREAAEAARHLGAIAYVNDTAKALQAYQTATELDPDDSWSWVYLGRLYQQAGDLAAAEQAFDEARAVAERAGDERDVMVADNSLGDVRVATGDLPGALAAYEAALATAQVLTAQDPGNTGWQRDLSVSHNKIGDVQRAQGNLGQALESYRASLALAERLAAADPGNAGWQRDLALSYGCIAAIDALQGERERALAALRQGRAIIARLREASPDHATLASALAWFDAEIAKLTG